MRYHKLIFAGVIAILAIGFVPCNGFSQVGSLDLSFDSDGKVVTPIGTGNDYGQAMTIQSDGKIIVAGYSRIGSGDAFALARYNANGSLDNSFDADGKVTTQIGVACRVHASAIQSDGKIVVAGYSSFSTTGFDFALARYNPNGSLDNSFDSDGMVTTDFGENGNEKAYSLAFQPDGKIVVAGYNSNSATNQRDFALVRYNQNGKIDSTFDGDGKVFLSLAPGMDEGRSVAIQNDGKIVLAGFSFNFSERVFGLVRFKTDGSLDSTFDSDGIVTTSISSNDDAAYSMAMQTDGKLVLAGYTSTNTTSYDFALVRYNSNGSLDTSFDSDGIVTTDIGTSSNLPYTLVIQSDGKMLAAGNAANSFAIARYNPDGSPDTSFDADGMVTTSIGSPVSEDVVRSVALQNDGKIVVAGESSNGADYDFALARYNNSGTTEIDFSFNSNSPFKIYPNPASTSVNLHVDATLIGLTYQIMDCTGKSHLSGQIPSENTRIELSNLPQGIYFLGVEGRIWKVFVDKR